MQALTDVVPFYRFPKPPPEIRLVILEFSLPGSHTLSVAGRRKPSGLFFVKTTIHTTLPRFPSVENLERSHSSITACALVQPTYMPIFLSVSYTLVRTGGIRFSAPAHLVTDICSSGVYGAVFRTDSSTRNSKIM